MRIGQGEVVRAKADFLITGDRDLLTLAPKFAIPIWTPEALRESLPK